MLLVRSYCKQIQKRADDDVVAPPSGYLPAQDYEDDDLSGYNARAANSEDETETTRTNTSLGEETTISPSKDVRKTLQCLFFLKNTDSLYQF